MEVHQFFLNLQNKPRENKHSEIVNYKIHFAASLLVCTTRRPTGRHWIHTSSAHGIHAGQSRDKMLGKCVCT